MDFKQASDDIKGAIGNLIELLGDISPGNAHKASGKKIKPFTNREFTEIYTMCYNLCVEQSENTYTDQLYKLHSHTFSTYLSKTVFNVLNPLRDFKLLEEFVERWRQHKIMSKWLRMMFRYLDRFYVKQNAKLSLDEVAISMFRNIIYVPLKEQFSHSVMSLINTYRDNHNLDISILSECIEIYVAVSGKELNSSNDTVTSPILDIYSDDFEINFLKISNNFYNIKTVTWLNNYNVTEYLLKVQEILEFEGLLTKRYFLKASKDIWMKRNNDIITDLTTFDASLSTLAKLFVELRRVLLKEVEEQLLIRGEYDGIVYLLSNSKLQDLSMLYSLYSKVEEGLVLIGKEFKKFIQSELSVYNSLTKKQDDIISIINSVLGLHDKFENLIFHQFQNNSLLARAMKEAFESVINLKLKTNKITFAEVLATYMDIQQKNSKIDDKTRFDRLDKSIKLFLYLEEKDRFSEIYRVQLSKRLLTGKTNENRESPMILKFKSHLGGGYTNKMEGMVKDLMTGRGNKSLFIKYALTKGIKQSVTDQDMIEVEDMTFGVDLLTQGYWPSNKQIDLEYPIEMKQCLNLYETYYRQEFDKKKVLNWVHALGTCIITTTIAQQEIELTLSTLQAAALLLFNQHSKLQFKEIQKLLNVEDTICKKVLHSFYRLKILAKEGGNSKKIDNEKDIFFVNEKFKPKRNKMKVPMSSLEESHNPKKVSEDRKDAIDAMIVRIMKTRKKYEHNRLVGDVMQQLHFFRPEGKQIKQRIASLIEREYLERDEDNHDVYLYIS